MLLQWHSAQQDHTEERDIHQYLQEGIETYTNTYRKQEETKLCKDKVERPRNSQRQAQASLKVFMQ